MLALEELRRADRLQETALADLEAGRPSRAERGVLRALAALDRVPVSPDADELRVRSLLSLASARADLRSVDEGLQVLLDAEAVVERMNDPGMQALVDHQHGWLMLGAGRARDALTYFNSAATQFPRLAVHNQCSVLNGRAFAHSDLHDVDAARADWAEFGRRATAAGLTRLQFIARHNLAWADYLAGDLPRALAAMDDAATSAVDTERGVVTMDRARVLLEAGLTAEADRALAAASAEFARTRASLEHALAELARAECALLEADPVRAERFAARAARRLRRRGSTSLALAADLTVLQARARARSRREKVADQALALQSDLAAAGQNMHSRLAGLLAAELLVDEGRLGEARALLTRGVRIRRGDRIGHRLQARVAATKLALAENDEAAARRIIRRGTQEIAGHQAIFGSVDLRTAAAVHGRRLATLDLDMALSDGRPARVFEAVERARAISSRLPPIRPPADDQTAALVAELRSIVELGRGRAAVDDAAARRRAAVETRIAELAWAQSSARPGHPPAGGMSADLLRPVAVRDVRQRLAVTGTQMVTYGRSGSRLYAVVLGAGPTRLVDLGRAALIRERISRVRADLDAMAGRTLSPGLHTTIARALRNDLAALDAAAVVPLGLTSDRVVVVAGGAVSTVPWGSLPSLRAVSSSVVPSATWWNQMASLPAPSLRRDATVIALSGPALGRADREVEDIARVWANSRTVSGADATVSALAQALNEADIVHVAAHGRHEPQNPLFSSMRMFDGLLFAHELGRDAVRATQVVLSACDVGLSTVRPGDEAVGMTSVLLNTGPRTVVASVSRIADDVAHAAMVGYHRALADGAAPAAAVRAMVAASPEALPLVCFGLG